MFTAAEKKYLAMTAALLMMGGGLKAYRLTGSRIGPFSEAGLGLPLAAGSLPADPARSDSTSAPDSAGRDSAAARDSGAGDSSAGMALSGVPSPEQGARKTGGRRHPGGAPPKAAAPVRLNEAGAQELVTVPGIGEKTARAIVDYRRAHGAFRRLEDLLNVKGIGEKKLERMRPLLLLAPADSGAP